eukprot:4421623-Ditylum_brightwellii.AAC.1
MLDEHKDNFYKYNGGAGNNTINDKDISLTIGGYESALLEDIMALCLFEMTTEQFTTAIICGIYKDNCLVVFDGCHSI